MGNIALGKTATANNSILPYIPSRAVDGALAPSNRWLSDSIPAWLAINPGALYMVNRWVVKHPSIINSPNNGWNSSNYASIDYKLQGSNDNASWYDIDSVTNNSVASTDRTFTPVAYNYYRVYITKGLRCNTGTTSIVEFELYQAYSNQLAGLTVNVGTLTPAFSPTVFAYTNTVGPDVVSINITPTAKDPQAVIKINGNVSPSGQPKSVNLNYGVNNIVVNVTAGDGSQNNYTIAVTRQGNADLKSLQAVSNGLVNVPLNPAFDKGITAYTAKIDYDSTEISYIPTTDDPLATIKLDGTSTPNGSISGATVVGTGITSSLEVTSTSGNKKTYTVAVSKNTSAYLTNFQVKKGSGFVAFSPVFTRNNFGTYLLNVGTSTGAYIYITKEDANATAVVTSNGTPLTLSGTSYPLSMPTAGLYAIVVTVTSTTGSIKTYTLNITRN
jgi:hypothetical protein